jgi:hypothetical protein
MQQPIFQFLANKTSNAARFEYCVPLHRLTRRLASFCHASSDMEASYEKTS